MTEVNPVVNRGQFIKNAAKGSLVLVGSGGVLASMDGVAFASGLRKSDIATLQVGYIAESLAVKVYTAIINNFKSFKGLKNEDYFVAALKNEIAHKTAWKDALGPKTPRRASACTFQVLQWQAPRPSPAPALPWRWPSSKPTSGLSSRSAPRT